MDTDRELKLKLHWEKKAKEVSGEEIVFGSVLQEFWSRALDAKNFSELKDFLGIKGRETLLDIGCGPLARAEVQYSLTGYNIVGIDISRTTARKAKKNVKKHGKAGNVGVVVGDAEHLPFMESSFDGALCIGTISHLPSVQSVKNAINEMRRVVRTHGAIYIPFFLNLYSLSGFERSIVMRILDLLKVDRAQYLLFKGLGEINHIFSCCGLRVRTLRYGLLVEFPWIFYPSPTLIRKIIGRIVDTLNEFHKRNSTFSEFSSAFEVTCEKVPEFYLKQKKLNGYYEFF